MTTRHAMIGVLLAAGVTAAGPAAAQPRVAASIVPIHALAAGVMAGIGRPDLIVGGAGSPHSYAMRPSEARALNEAQLVFWVGEALEVFLEKPLAALAAKARVVALIEAPGVNILPAREGGAWEEEGDDHGHGHAHGHGRKDDPHAGTDAHAWLDIDNAKAITRAIAAALGEADAGSRAAYARNGEAVLRRLDALDGELRALLQPVQGKPFVVFHDAYQYFEKRYGLAAIGSVTVSPDRKPGARRLSAIRRKLRDLKAACVFSEPNFEPTLLKTITEGTKARIGRALNPEGAGMTPGPDAYFAMMREIGANLKDCLAAG